MPTVRSNWQLQAVLPLPCSPQLSVPRLCPQDGEEWVEALKLTGDANVPAGAVSFKARVGAAHKLKAGGAGVPEQFGVACRFQGSGCVAQQGNQNASWVEGELLVFSDSGPVGRHHELGFMWHVPGDRNFLVLLSRLDLSLAHAQA